MNAVLQQALSEALGALAEDILANKRAKGWRVTDSASWTEPDHIPAVLALLHSEVSEALEAFRNDERAGFAEELADVLIRLLGLAHGLGIDLGAEVTAKVEKNRQRAYQHGGKRI